MALHLKVNLHIGRSVERARSYIIRNKKAKNTYNNLLAAGKAFEILNWEHDRALDASYNHEVSTVVSPKLQDSVDIVERRSTVLTAYRAA